MNVKHLQVTRDVEHPCVKIIIINYNNKKNWKHKNVDL